MNDKRNIIKDLRTYLVPGGTADLIYLTLGTAPFYQGEFVRKCIDELELKAVTVSCGMEEFTALEKLGFEVLLNSAYHKGMPDIKG